MTPQGVSSPLPCREHPGAAHVIALAAAAQDQRDHFVIEGDGHEIRFSLLGGSGIGGTGTR